MQKRILTLIRHAEAGSAHGSRIRDCDRPLTERGRKEARELGLRLAGMGFMPDRIWCSDAERAEVSARILSSELSLSGQSIELRPSLYLAHTTAISEMIAVV